MAEHKLYRYRPTFNPEYPQIWLRKTCLKPQRAIGNGKQLKGVTYWEAVSSLIYAAYTLLFKKGLGLVDPPLKYRTYLNSTSARYS